MSRSRDVQRRGLPLVDKRELCEVCAQHRAADLGLCHRCLDSYTNMRVFDAQLAQIREAARS